MFVSPLIYRLKRYQGTAPDPREDLAYVIIFIKRTRLWIIRVFIFEKSPPPPTHSSEKFDHVCQIMVSSTLPWYIEM